ncbi:MAG: sigma-70 family RNA polymerase sigma factor [Actinobacteria bacterium]|nr:sigma-70 family RNA polymerase sigma factor [Actinomycetota bacterium]
MGARPTSTAPADAHDAMRRARFEALATEVYEPLQRYVRRRIDAAAADDVVSDTLLVCWRRLDDVPDDAALAWTLGVARRCLANDRRGERRQANVGHRLAAQPVAPPDSADENDLVADLHTALAELPDTDREIVLLWAWDGLPPRDIAVALGLSANAVSIRLHRVKQRLAERLGPARDAGFLSVGGHTFDRWLVRKIRQAGGHLPGERIDRRKEDR